MLGWISGWLVGWVVGLVGGWVAFSVPSPSLRRCRVCPRGLQPNHRLGDSSEAVRTRNSPDLPSFTPCLSALWADALLVPNTNLVNWDADSQTVGLNSAKLQFGHLATESGHTSQAAAPR